MEDRSSPIVPDATFASRPYETKTHKLNRFELPSDEVNILGPVRDSLKGSGELADRLSRLIAGSVAGYLETDGNGKTLVSLVIPRDSSLQ